EEAHQSGVLLANVPADLSVAAAGCQIRIDFIEGNVVYCHIEDSTGRVQVLSNQRSLSLLYGMGKLEWYLELRSLDSSSFTDHSSFTNPSPSTNPSSFNAPQRNTTPLPGTSSYATAPLQGISSVVPRPVINTNPRLLQSLPQIQRRVLALVDGTRSIEKISTLLFPSSRNTSEVYRVLRELETLRLIIMEM
ncbi:MAG TPA: hypothetical protein VH593_13675, partial [Ktedonobacteraceae bacterium]